MPSPANTRRGDIQGLRAIAVLSVIAYHAHLPVPGGFTGVDVFFVISGFVITAMLGREWQTHGRIRLGRFYLRRFKRLTPALAVMTAVTLGLATLIVSPLGPQQIAGKTAIGAMAFVANIVIAHTTGSYFDDAADVNPFLHTWSLSVEEQFYMFFPALLAAVWIMARRRFHVVPLVALWLVTLGSFTAAVAGSLHGVSGGREIIGFYSTFSRAWEFGVGALIAAASPRLARMSSAVLATAALAGGAALLAGFALIRGTTPFPGVWALLPVVGTALLIIGGFDSPRSPVTRALSRRPMTLIGDWSYSLYLWHWPFIVFATMLWPLTPWAAPAAAAASFVPAIASYHLVEEPLRRSGWSFGVRRIAVIATVFAVPVVAGVAVISVADRYWKPRFADGRVAATYPGDIGARPFFSYLNHTYPLCADPAMRANARRQPFLTDLPQCYQSRTGPVDVVLMGDSHAEHMFPGLAEAAPADNIAYYFTQDRPYLRTPTTRRVVAAIDATPTVKTVVLNAWWWRDTFTPSELVPTLQALRRDGRTVIVLDDVPSFPFEAFNCKFRQMPLLPPRCGIDAATSSGQRRQSQLALRDSVAQVPGVRLIATYPLLCPGRRCTMVADDELLYRDSHHLNLLGSRYVMRRMIADNPSVAAALDVTPSSAAVAGATP